MSKIDINKLADICINYRKENDITQLEMAKLIPINDQIYGKVERQQHLPKLDQLESILKITRKSFIDITEESNKPAVFVALKGEANTEEELKVFNELIDMILCLDKHNNLRENNYGRE